MQLAASIVAQRSPGFQPASVLPLPTLLMPGTHRGGGMAKLQCSSWAESGASGYLSLYPKDLVQCLIQRRSPLSALGRKLNGLAE